MICVTQNFYENRPHQRVSESHFPITVPVTIQRFTFKCSEHFESDANELQLLTARLHRFSANCRSDGGCTPFEFWSWERGGYIHAVATGNGGREGRLYYLTGKLRPRHFVIDQMRALELCIRLSCERKTRFNIIFIFRPMSLKRVFQLQLYTYLFSPDPRHMRRWWHHAWQYHFIILSTRSANQKALHYVSANSVSLGAEIDQSV